MMNGYLPTTVSCRDLVRPARILACLWIAVVCLSSAGAQEQRTMTRQALRDKIRGGWAGQMIGVAYGAPTEFRSKARILEGELAWKAGMLENTIHQDDLYVEMTFSKVMDE